MKKLDIAVDFDGTITKGDCWPEVGELREDAIYCIRKLYEEGHCIIIWTCREDETKAKAVQALFNNRVPFHFINENNPERIARFGSDCRKIGADVYVDDKAVGGLPDWWKTYCYILEKANS
jgi:hypothetical protein